MPFRSQALPIGQMYWGVSRLSSARCSVQETCVCTSPHSGTRGLHKQCVPYMPVCLYGCARPRSFHLGSGLFVSPRAWYSVLFCQDDDAVTRRSPDQCYLLQRSDLRMRGVHFASGCFAVLRGFGMTDSGPILHLQRSVLCLRDGYLAGVSFGVPLEFRHNGLRPNKFTYSAPICACGKSTWPDRACSSSR